MKKTKKALPEPPKRPFGRRQMPESGKEEPLLADRIALAAAEGKLDRFIEEEVPGGEFGRRLANMMMGMTGMLPQSEIPDPAGTRQASTTVSNDSSSFPPEDVMKAVQSEDVEGLIGILKREHKKRAGATQEDFSEQGPVGKTDIHAVPPMIEKKIIDQLLRIAEENQVSTDWILLRAIKLYILDYQKTGRL